MSRIFEALTVARDAGVDKIKSLSPGRAEPTDGSGELLPDVAVPASVDIWWKEQSVRFPERLNWSHKKIRNCLILAFFAMGLVLLGTNHAFRPRVSVFGNTQSVYGVAFEGAVHPASEVRITAESTGTVSEIFVKVGDTVQEGQQLLRMDDREAQLTVKQAGVELEAAKTKLDKFRLRLADVDAALAWLEAAQ